MLIPSWQHQGQLNEKKALFSTIPLEKDGRARRRLRFQKCLKSIRPSTATFYILALSHAILLAYEWPSWKHPLHKVLEL
jgi:hypothetical protein